MKTSLPCLALLATGALAQSGPWGQCGGNNWTGPTTCVNGFTCSYFHEWYSQCLPNDQVTTSTRTTSSTRTSSTSTRTSTTSTRTSTTSTKTSTTSTRTSTAPTSSPTTAPGGLKWLGVNEAVAEFGQGSYPGVEGTHYRFPDTVAVGKLIDDGFNMFRIPFAMERLAQGSLSAELNAGYLKGLADTVNYITGRGAWAVIDPHNFGRYNGNVITDLAAWESFWTKVATKFRDNSLVVFDTNNEYNTMDQAHVVELNQRAINAIRAAGATSQYIFVEGNSWSGAWTWVDINTSLGALYDPQNRIVFEMHQYLDSDGSGTNAVCVSSTIGVERVRSATKWLKDNNKKGILGEFAGAPNTVCRDAIAGLMKHVNENSDQWLGALWWSAGPWWADYMFSFEPPSGVGYQYYRDLLRQYIP